MKRVFDFVVSLGLFLVLLPLLAVIAIWIKFDSPGPVFFRQARVGLAGREFRVFKFRTMCVDAEKSGRLLTVGQDVRITRVGRFLRAHKLDELPQLLNVLVGDMSMVGPRPEVPMYVAMYPDHLRLLILSIRPGITDLASISFREENELLAGSSDPEIQYTREIMPAKLMAYADYVRTHGFWMDLKIILLTVGAIVFRRQGHRPRPH